jgi:hypothetical protein
MFNGQRPQKGNKALEVAMRDVMEGLLDAVSHAAYRPTPDTLEILSIEAPKADPYAVPRPTPTRRVRPIAAARSHDVVDYLMRREQQLERLSA